MSAMMNLITACAVFVGGHFLLSHPLRRVLATRLGEGPFRGLYSLIALGSFAWIIVAWLHVPATPPAYVPGTLSWSIATFVMWLASILLVGSFARNPALPAPNAAATAATNPLGMLAITRHPMMWAFALWAIVQMMLGPTKENHVLTTAILILALGGSAAQDFKKSKLMGEVWRNWMSRTSFFPFGALLTGRASWAATWPGWPVLIAGTVLWLVVTWAHTPLGSRLPAGIWYWL